MVELAEIAQDQENLVIHQAAVVAQTLVGLEAEVLAVEETAGLMEQGLLEQPIVAVAVVVQG
jgi:hypothetical protein